MSSIQWEDFERIHVVRKIREVIGSWFHVDILLVDDQGKIRNSFKGDESPRANFLMKKILNQDVGWEYLSQVVEKVNAQLLKSNLRFHELRIQISTFNFFYIYQSQVYIHVRTCKMDTSCERQKLCGS